MSNILGRYCLTREPIPTCDILRTMEYFLAMRVHRSAWCGMPVGWADAEACWRSRFEIWRSEGRKMGDLRVRRRPNMQWNMI